MTQPHNNWSAALDAIEAQLAATQTALTARAAPPQAPSAAVPDEPLPPDLADRAQALLARSRHLEAAATHERERLQKALRSLPVRTAPTARTRTGHVVDVGA